MVSGVDLQGTAATYDRPAPHPLAIRATLGIGYRSLGMDLTSNAEGGLTNYLLRRRRDRRGARRRCDAAPRARPWFAAA
jgi:hypothetical protein